MIRVLEIGNLRLVDDPELGPAREVMGALLACDTEDEVRSLGRLLYREVAVHEVPRPQIALPLGGRP